MNAKPNTRSRGASMAAAAAVAAAAATRREDAPTLGMRRVLQVISKKDGFRRAGRAWHGTSTVPLDEITPYHEYLLRSEPMLVVLEVEVPEEDVETLKAADRAADDESATDAGAADEKAED